MTVKITDGALTYTYHNPRSCFKLDDADTIKATDAAVWTKLDEMAVFSVEVAGYDEGDTPQRLTGENGLQEGDVPIGKYVKVEVSDNIQDEDGDLITGATLWMYYTEEELDRSGDGDDDDPVDIDEETLTLYRYNEDKGTWTKLTDDLDWVEGTGQDTTDLEMFGTSYAGHIWANLTRLSLFSAGGKLRSDAVTTADPGPDITVSVGEEVRFDGSASVGAGELVEFTWTFKHQGKRMTLRGEKPVFIFRTDGVYTITLEVRDEYEGLGTATFTVTVEAIVFTLEVGPIVDEQSTPVHDALVELTWGEQVFTGHTGFRGIVEFELGVDAIGDDVSINITADGYMSQMYDTSIGAERELAQAPSPLVKVEEPPPPSDDDEGIPGGYWALLVCLVLIVILSLAYVLRDTQSQPWKREKKEKEPKKEDKEK
jgi:hypothetical protein